MSIFIKQKKIKFRKRKCGKDQIFEEYIGGFNGYINKVRFDFIEQTDDDVAGGRDLLWGSSPL